MEGNITSIKAKLFKKAREGRWPEVMHDLKRIDTSDIIVEESDDDDIPLTPYKEHQQQLLHRFRSIRSGDTLLHIAIRKPIAPIPAATIDVIEQLIKLGSDLRCLNAIGNTPIDEAYPEIKEWLQQWLPEEKSICLSAPVVSGELSVMTRDLSITSSNTSDGFGMSIVELGQDVALANNALGQTTTLLDESEVIKNFIRKLE